MNKVELMGRLTRNPEIRYSNGDNSVVVSRFNLAVNRRHVKEGQQETDFINCVAFGKLAEFTEQYLRKGIKIAAVGRIQTGNYTNKEGHKVYTTDIVLEEIYFAEKKQGGTDVQSDESSAPVDENGFMNIPDGIDEELPFN